MLNLSYFYLITITVWISCWLLTRSGECSPWSLPVVHLGSSELLVFWTNDECQKRRVFQSLFPEMAQQAQLTGEYSCCHTLGSSGQPHKFSQCGVMELVCPAVCPWVHSNLYHQFHYCIYSILWLSMVIR